MVPSLEPFVSLLQIWSECPQTSHHPTTTTLNLRWNWKCYNTVATATFDRNGKTQPTAECHVLQLKHSGAQKVILPLLFDLRHRFEAAEAKVLFQNLNSTETIVLDWFTAPPLKVALGIAGLARHGINKLVQAASGEPNTEFHSLNVLPLMTLTKVFLNGITKSAKTLCADCCEAAQLTTCALKH